VRARALLLASAAVLASCESEHEPERPSAAESRLTAVVEPAIRALEAELPAPEPAPPERLDAIAAEIDEFLPIAATASPDMRALALEDLLAFGAPAEPVLRDALFDEERDANERIVAAEALGRRDTPYAASVLVELLDHEVGAWIKAHAAWALGLGQQDWVVPKLARRLRYEVDREAWCWLAKTLARFHNFSGVLGLEDVASNDPSADMRALAAGMLDELCAEHGFDDPANLRWHWEIGNVDGRLPPEITSERQRLEIWRFVRDLGDFQLRPVDDARFALSSLGEPAAHVLAEALREREDHIRLHAAQTLGRMGPRGHVAGPELVRTLDDPVAGAEAAQALGAVAYKDAEAALIERLAPTVGLELRVASARALGGLRLASSAGALAPYVDSKEPVDLRAACAASLLSCAPPERCRAAVELLAELMTGGGGIDPARPEKALSDWLARSASADSSAAQDVWSTWGALDEGTASGPQDPALERERRERRAELLLAHLDALTR